MISGAKLRWVAQSGPLWMISPRDAQIVAEVEALVFKGARCPRKSAQRQVGFAGFELQFKMSGIQWHCAQAEPAAFPAIRVTSGGRKRIVPTSETSTLKTRSEVRGLNDGADAQRPSDAIRRLRSGSAISAALGVSCIAWPSRALPLRMTSGSPKYVRSLARTLLTEGWVVPSVCAARVKLRSCRTAFNVLRSRSRRSASFRLVMIIIPGWT